MGSLTHSRRPNGRDTPHHIRCLSCRSGFFDDLLPTAVPGLDTNAGGTLCSIVPSVSGHPRRRGTGSGLPDARTVSQGGADSDSSMLLTHTCSGLAARPGRSSSPMRPAVCPVERDTPVPFPSPAQGRPCSCLARRRTVSHVFGTGSWFIGKIVLLPIRNSITQQCYIDKSTLRRVASAVAVYTMHRQEKRGRTSL